MSQTTTTTAENLDYVPFEATTTEPAAEAGPVELERLRDVITNVLTDANSNELVQRAGREKLKEEVLKQIRATTDVKVDKVLFTDVAVQ